MLSLAHLHLITYTIVASMALNDQCQPHVPYRMARKQWELNFSMYDGSRRGVTRKSFGERFPITTARLQERFTLPGVEAAIKRMKERGKSGFFIEHDKTTHTDVRTFFKNYELWNIKHRLNTAVRGLSSAQAYDLFERLQREPVGANDPPKEDAKCYTADTVMQTATAVLPATTGAAPPTVSASTAPAPAAGATLRSGATLPPPSSTAAAPAPAPATTPGATLPIMSALVNTTIYRATTFLGTMQFHQKELYIAMRNNLGDYMDAAAKCTYENYISQEDKQLADSMPALTDDGFFLVKNRLKWATIKDFVHDVICTAPRKGDKIAVFRTTLRNDSSLLPSWISDVSDLEKDAANLGSEYAVVAKGEAMATATRWVTKTEQTLLETLAVTKGVANTYPTFKSMADKMNLSTLSTYVNQIQTSKLPKNFKQSKSKEALNDSLFT